MHDSIPPPDPDRLLAGLRSGAWLDAQTFPPITWIVRGLIPEGMTLLIGGPKIGKSWFSLSVALAVAGGTEALGAIPVGRPRPVLLLALEDGDRRLQGRARKLLPEGDPIPDLLDYMTRVQPNMLVATIEAWLDQLRAGSPAPLVILDTLGKVMPDAAPGQTAYSRDYKIAGRLKQIADDHPGMALLVLHHDRKATSEDFVDGVSGTNGIAGAADTIVVIARSRTEETGLLKVTGRDVPEREYAATVVDGFWRLTGANLDEAAAAAETVRATAGLADRSAEIVRIVGEHPQGVRTEDISTALGMSDNEVRTYLSRLHKAGRIDRPSRGLYTPVASVASVAFEGDHAADQAEHNTRNTCNTPSRECRICSNELGDIDPDDLCGFCEQVAS